MCITLLIYLNEFLDFVLPYLVKSMCIYIEREMDGQIV